MLELSQNHIHMSENGFDAVFAPVGLFIENALILRLTRLATTLRDFSKSFGNSSSQYHSLSFSYVNSSSQYYSFYEKLTEWMHLLCHRERICNLVYNVKP